MIVLTQDNNVDIAFRQISEGQLLKYTNMVKGWQNRWFVLNPHSGMLEYYMVRTMLMRIISKEIFLSIYAVPKEALLLSLLND